MQITFLILESKVKRCHSLCVIKGEKSLDLKHI